MGQLSTGVVVVVRVVEPPGLVVVGICDELDVVVALELEGVVTTEW